MWKHNVPMLNWGPSHQHLELMLACCSALSRWHLKLELMPIHSHSLLQQHLMCSLTACWALAWHHVVCPIAPLSSTVSHSCPASCPQCLGFRDCGSLSCTNKFNTVLNLGAAQGDK